MDHSATVDPTARVHAGAVLGKGVRIGPFCVVERDVVLGEGTRLVSHCTVGPNTTLGKDNVVYPFAAVGGDPQDLLWRGEETFLVCGDKNTFREGVTVNRGTPKGDGFTRLGSGNLIMANAHIAHDCLLGDGTILANNVLLAGHVVVEDRAILNGAAGVHQFTTIGKLAYVGGLSRIVQDVPPFMIVEGHPSEVRKVNIVGLQRHGYSEDAITALKNAHRDLFRARRPRADVLTELERHPETPPEVAELCAFLRRIERGKFGRSRNV